jgi:hypothetical protein
VATLGWATWHCMIGSYNHVINTITFQLICLFTLIRMPHGNTGLGHVALYDWFVQPCNQYNHLPTHLFIQQLNPHLCSQQLNLPCVISTVCHVSWNCMIGSYNHVINTITFQLICLFTLSIIMVSCGKTGLGHMELYDWFVQPCNQYNHLPTHLSIHPN